MMNLDSFTLAELTGAINRFPTVYGRVNELGLFPWQGTLSRSVIIDDREGEISLIPAHDWGAPGTWAKRDGRATKSIAIPQTVHNDDIDPNDVQGVRAFGTEDQLQPMAAEVAERMQRMRRRHDITLEWRRIGALRGQVLNADGTGVILDLFQELAPAGVVKQVVDFAFSNAATKVRPLCIDIHHHMDDALNGDVYNDIHVLCSEEFFAALIDHDDVAKTYLNHQAAIDQRGGDLRKGFRYGDVLFEEYRGKATMPPPAAAPNNVLRFIEANKAIAFPIGTQSTFVTYAAPADFNETVNTKGLPYYAKTRPKEFDRGWEVHTQSNNVPVCLKPGCLIELTMS